MKIDKSVLLHIAVCFLTTALLPYGWIIALLAGIAKECYDKYIKKTTFDWFDIIGDLLGISLGLIYKFIL
jgi:hypothetical protein